jgi:hypothetical protein
MSKMARTKRLAKRSGVLNRRPNLNDHMVTIKDTKKSNAVIKVARMRPKYAARRSHHVQPHQHATPGPIVLATNTEDVTVKPTIRNDDVCKFEVTTAIECSTEIPQEFRSQSKILHSKMKIKTVISTVFPHIKYINQPHIKKIGQGTFNKIYGMIVPPVGSHVLRSSLTGQFEFQYFVRIPYDREATGQDLADETAREVAILQVVNARLSFPTPTVIEYSVGSNNALGQPFIV